MEDASAGGDPLRHYEPKAADGTSAMFHAINRGKGSVSLPFRDPATRAALKRMVAEADVLVESFRPGTLETMLGVGSSALLLKEYRRLVLVRLSGYGPKRSEPGHDLNFMAAAGVKSHVSHSSHAIYLLTRSEVRCGRAYL